MTKHLPLALSVSLLVVQLPAFADAPSPVGTAQPGEVPPPPDRTAQLTVNSLKPGLTARHQLTLRGVTKQKPLGGYQWKIESTVRPAEGASRGAVKIMISGTAKPGAALIKGVPSDFEVDHRFEVAQLKELHGEFEVEVVDAAGALLFQTVIKT